MRKLFIIAISVLALTGCQGSMDDRAEREAMEYTQKNCPTPFINNIRTDSLTYDRATQTFTYYSLLQGPMDDSVVFAPHNAEIREGMIKDTKNSAQLRAYKDAGLSFRYVIRSSKNPDVVLFDTTIGPKEYSK
ncbi:MAG: hypothetical protein K6C10_04650 [Prevotella sp.]|nr:hypothetical protein [Prevotella sp.]